MHKVEVGIGPMSYEIIDCVVKYANQYDEKIMLIASRNQIEAKELGGGYVLDSETFVNHVRDIDTGNKIEICRDHSGPYLNDKEKNLSFDDAMFITKKSLTSDIVSGFDLIHIDTCRCPDPHAAAKELFDHCLIVADELKRNIDFEFGSEENVGVASSIDAFEKNVLLAKEFVNPRFVVGQTGSLTKSIFQVGSFNEDVVKRLVEIADKHNTKLKEHNCDYNTIAEVQKRQELRVGGINIAPELGSIQTRITCDLGTLMGLDSLVNEYKELVIKEEKWKKWSYGDFTNDYKVLSAGHYHFNTYEYEKLYIAIHQNINFDDILYEIVEKVLDTYTLRNV